MSVNILMDGKNLYINNLNTIMNYIICETIHSYTHGYSLKVIAQLRTVSLCQAENSARSVVIKRHIYNKREVKLTSYA